MNSISNRIHFSVGFVSLPVPVRDVWETLAAFLAKHDALPKTVEISQMAGHPPRLQSEQVLKLSIAEVADLISSRSLAGFHVYAGKSTRATDYYLLDFRSERKDFKLGCLIERDARAPSDWTQFIELVTAGRACIGAWQYIKSYQFWQGDNIGDRFYELRWGKIPPGYRRWSEPAPNAVIPQPDRVFIDISLNPGRAKSLTPMINFLPTAEMWLGPHFWQYAKCTKEEALAADFFIEKRDTPHFLYLKCWPQPFTRPDGDQGRVQQKLWKLFFNEDCEWPPGSGGICDEPMYGPPELMP